MSVETTKKGRPWTMCYPCGVRIFINGPHGIRVLEKMIKAYGGDEDLATLWMKQLQKALKKGRK